MDNEDGADDGGEERKAKERARGKERTKESEKEGGRGRRKGNGSEERETGSEGSKFPTRIINIQAVKGRRLNGEGKRVGRNRVNQAKMEWLKARRREEIDLKAFSLQRLDRFTCHPGTLSDFPFSILY